MRNYEEEAQKSVDSFLYLKGVLEEIARNLKEKAQQQGKVGK